MVIMKNYFLILLLLCYGCSDSKPPETVIDRSGILNKKEIQRLQDYNAALLRDHDIDFRLIMEKGGLHGTQFNLRANRLMEEVVEETQTIQGRIILLYIDSKSDLVRLEISGDLEWIYTDAFSGYIQQQHMVYFFREQRIQDGVLAASELIYERARDAGLGKDFVEPQDVLAGGGGATAQARISGNSIIPERESLIETKEIQAGMSPMETIMIYKLSMAAGNTDPQKDIYTKETRAMMENWTVTPAQLRNGVKGIERCSKFQSQILFDQSNNLAVIRYPVKERQCNPWFLEKGEGRWRLDLKTMQKTIISNQKNQYHFKEFGHPYMFGFTDLRFDKNGFPHQ